MNPQTSLIVATDLSPHAEWAARRAALLGAQLQTGLEVLHVTGNSAAGAMGADAGSAEEGDLRAALEYEIEGEVTALAAKLRSAGVEVRTTIRSGVALKEISEAARGSDLLVLGSAGQHPWRDMFIGSTADRLLRKAPCPMLVVKRSPHGPYRRVLIPVDLGSEDPAGLQMLVATALKFAPDAECQVFHAADFPYEGKMALAGVAAERIRDYRESVVNRARSQLQELVASVADGASRCVSHVSPGDPTHLVPRQAAAMEADLIVMFKQSSSLVEDWLLGSVTRHTLFHANRDVLVVPPRAG